MTTIDYAGRAEFYDVEYATDVDHAFLESFVDATVHDVLEVPCGSGRNLAWLAATGRDVYAVDREIAMAARAHRSHAYSNIHVIGADMRSLPFRRAFDLVVLPQGALQLLGSRRIATEVLLGIGQLLTTNGRVIIDLATFNRASTSDSRVRPSYFDPTSKNGIELFDWVRPTADGGGTLTRSHIQRLRERALDVEFRYLIREPRGERHLRFTMQLQRWTYAELVALVEAAGLRLHQTYVDYRLDPVDRTQLADADRWLLVLRRNA